VRYEIRHDENYMSDTGWPSLRGDGELSDPVVKSFVSQHAAVVILHAFACERMQDDNFPAAALFTAGIAGRGAHI
jgi:hypothetical protein